MKRLLVWLILICLCMAAGAERSSPILVDSGATLQTEFCVVGDFVIHDSLIRSAKSEAQRTKNAMGYDFSPMLTYVKELLSGADFTVANVDGVFYGDSKKPYAGYPTFNTPPALLYALKDAGVDMLTMANNHSLDYWYDGLKVSIDNVDAAGLMHIGAARSQEERDFPKIIDIRGIRFGFLNYTTTLNLMDRRAALDPDALIYGVNFETNADFEADVRALREGGAEMVICFMHWGTEYRATSSSVQQRLALSLMKAGVDVIMGGHPHVVEPAEWIQGTNQFGESQKTLCVYSLGNFLSGQRTSGRDGGILFRFTVKKDAYGNVSVSDTSYVSAWVWKQGSTYRVLPVNQTKASRVAGMTNAEYNAMLACQKIHEKAMTAGSLKPRQDDR